MIMNFHFKKALLLLKNSDLISNKSFMMISSDPDKTF